MDILIVDDESDTISDLKTILEQLKHNVAAIVSDGEEAIQKAGDLNLDLILIDIKLKGQISGLEAANKIVDLYKIPIIYITDFYKDCINKSLQLPEDAIILSKPLKKDHLEYCISRAFFR